MQKPIKKMGMIKWVEGHLYCFALLISNKQIACFIYSAVFSKVNFMPELSVSTKTNQSYNNDSKLFFAK